MILSRIAKAIREQNWFAIAIEFVIVILGVVIGFQISAWNEARRERAEEAGFLHALSADTRYSREHLEQTAARLEVQQAALERLHRVHRGETGTGGDTFVADLANGLFYLSWLDVNESTFDTLVGSGRLSLIDDPELVGMLQTLSASYDDARATIDNEYQTTYRFSDPLLLQSADMAAVFRAGERYSNLVPWSSGVPPAPPVSNDWTADRAFGNVLLYRGAFVGALQEQVASLISDLDAIQTLIDERLRAIGEAS